MERALVVAGVLMVTLAACRGPRVEYEYEKPVAITSTAAEPSLFSPPPPTTTTTLAPERPSVWRRGEKR